MKGDLYIGNDKIGEVDFEIIDATMGCISGQLKINSNYIKYEVDIQTACDKNGVANIEDFNFKIILANSTKLKPEGGIGITDIKNFAEIYVEVSGLNLAILNP